MYACMNYAISVCKYNFSHWQKIEKNSDTLKPNIPADFDLMIRIVIHMSLRYRYTWLRLSYDYFRGSRYNLNLIKIKFMMYGKLFLFAFNKSTFARICQHLTHVCINII